MLIQALRQINIKKKTHKKLRENKQFDEIGFDGQVNSILILIEEKTEGLEEFFSNEYEVSLENIKILKFNSNKVQIEDVVVGEFLENDFGWFGKIKNNNIEEFINKKYDLLINYTVGNIYMDYLTSISKVKLKVGYSNTDVRLYDLLIDINSPDITVFNSELKKYLKILNK